jgi:hypothetical protein
MLFLKGLQDGLLKSGFYGTQLGVYFSRVAPFIQHLVDSCQLAFDVI